MSKGSLWLQDNISLVVSLETKKALRVCEAEGGDIDTLC